MKSSLVTRATALGAALACGLLTAFVPAAPAQVVGVWAKGVNGNWSTTGATGWTNGVVPNGIGDTASLDNGNATASETTTQNIAGGVTVGTISEFGTTTTGVIDRSWILAAGTNGITLNQDGAGPGRATISHSLSAAGSPVNSMVRLTGVITLADDLFISNTSNSIRSTGSVQMQVTNLTGNGNIFISNSGGAGPGAGDAVTSGNNPAQGAVAFSGQGSFGGNTTILKGAVTFTRGDCFAPIPSNVITIGSAGGGSATLVQTGNGGGFTMENNFVIAGGTGGTQLFGAVGAPTSNLVMHGSFALNGDLSVTADLNSAATPLTIDMQNTISGPGALTKLARGDLLLTTTFAGAVPNTYAGGTTITGGTVTASGAGRLGTGNVTVQTTATSLNLLTGVANAINDTAVLSLAGGGTAGVADAGFASLGTGVTETVGGLILGGVSMPAGTYGSSTSGAPVANQFDEYFSGNGVIVVAAAVPEPGSIALVGVAAGIVGGWSRRRTARANTHRPEDNPM